MKIWLMALALVTGTISTATKVEAFASDDLAVTAQTKRYSPGYYSNTTARFLVTYRDLEVPKDAQVFLRYGFGASQADKTLHWQFSNEIPMMYQLEGATYQIKVEQIMQARSGHMILNALEFVLRVQLPNGESYFIKGSDSPMGYFRSYLDVSGADFEWSAPQSLGLEVVHAN
jgi:hypothetical protein